jgi:hypothetical protein
MINGGDIADPHSIDQNQGSLMKSVCRMEINRHLVFRCEESGVSTDVKDRYRQKHNAGHDQNADTQFPPGKSLTLAMMILLSFTHDYMRETA